MDGKLEKILKIYESLSRHGDHCAVRSAGQGEICLPIRDFFFFTTEGAPKGKVAAFTTQGRIVLRPSETLPVLEARFASSPQFVRTHTSYLVNMDCVDRVAPVSAREHALRIKELPGRRIPVTEFYAERVKAALGLQSLDHVMPWNEQLAAIIREKLRRFDRDIRYMSAEELRANFSDSAGKLIVRRLMGNIIWQAYNWIEEGLIPHFEGNIRGFWYSHIKPVLARLGMSFEGQDKVMSSTFVDYTARYRLFKYKDFGFADDNEMYRKIGKINARVICFAEKVGHWKTLQLLHEQYDVTIIALGGQPSQLTTEYFMDELEHVTTPDEDFYIFAITDYDPSGWIIAESFATQLGVQGLRTIKNVIYGDDPWCVKDMRPCQLILPAYFTPEEIELNKYKVPDKTGDQKTKAKNWIAKGGGLNGEAFGLEADAMERTKLRALFYEKAKEYLKPVRHSEEGGRLLRRYGKVKNA